MPKQTTHRAWVITNDDCLYDGDWPTLVGAIAEHTSLIWSNRDGLPELPNYGPLTDFHRLAWERCRRNGDRAIHARIVY